MKKENLTVNMKKFNDLLGIEENQSLKIKRNLYLKGIHDGKILGPKTNIPDVDKDWLKNYSIDDIKNCSVPQETIYSYILKNNIDNLDAVALSYFGKEYTEAFAEQLKELLSPLENHVLYLHLMGTDYRTIAELLGKSPKSVDNALQRIKTKAQKILP